MALDLAMDEPCDLTTWDRNSAAHINICLEEPFKNEKVAASLNVKTQTFSSPQINFEPIHKALDLFLEKAKRPLVLVGSLKEGDKEAVAQFLLHLKAPVFLEGISLLREDPRLQPLIIKRTHRLFETGADVGYPIDAILRIGGIPTLRLWRDLEYMEGKISIFSLHDRPFSGLSYGPIICAPLGPFFESYEPPKSFLTDQARAFLQADLNYSRQLEKLLKEEPLAESTLVHTLSKKIAPNALVYLGNSLPIREWNLSATWENKHLHCLATRELNGIDGQTSTFFGLCRPEGENWALLGDLTALHDATAPWILRDLPEIKANIVVINNGGGKIFERRYPLKEIINTHNTDFSPMAAMWGLSYERWSEIPQDISCKTNRLIEIIPDDFASKRFWNKLDVL